MYMGTLPQAVAYCYLMKTVHLVLADSPMGIDVLDSWTVISNGGVAPHDTTRR